MSAALSFYNELQKSTEASATMRKLRLLCAQTESELSEIRRILLYEGMAWRPWIWQENGETSGQGNVTAAPFSQVDDAYS